MSLPCSGQTPDRQEGCWASLPTVQDGGAAVLTCRTVEDPQLCSRGLWAHGLGGSRGAAGGPGDPRWRPWNLPEELQPPSGATYNQKLV